MQKSFLDVWDADQTHFAASKELITVRGNPIVSEIAEMTRQIAQNPRKRPNAVELVRNMKGGVAPQIGVSILYNDDAVCLQTVYMIGFQQLLSGGRLQGRKLKIAARVKRRNELNCPGAQIADTIKQDDGMRIRHF